MAGNQLADNYDEYVAQVFSPMERLSIAFKRAITDDVVLQDRDKTQVRLALNDLLLDSMALRDLFFDFGEGTLERVENGTAQLKNSRHKLERAVSLKEVIEHVKDYGLTGWAKETHADRVKRFLADLHSRISEVRRQGDPAQIDVLLEEIDAVLNKGPLDQFLAFRTKAREAASRHYADFVRDYPV